MSRGPQRVRSAAARVLQRTLASKAPLAPFLQSEEVDLDERDRRLLHHLVYGCLRWLRRLDHVISAASGRRVASIDRKLLWPLRLGVFELLYLDRVPPYAAVSEAVAEARRRTHRGGAALVNAVLRKVARDASPEAWPVVDGSLARRLAIESSHSDLLVSRWLRRYGQRRTRQLLVDNNREKPLHLLSFMDLGGPERLRKTLGVEGLEAEPSSLSPLGLIVRRGNPLETRGFRDGLFYLQDEVSQVSVLLPPPAAADCVLDVAASPGGKSFALLALRSDLSIVCGEAAIHRLSRLRHNMARLGRRLPIVAVQAQHPAFGGRFDRVVVDLPCSGSGTLRKHPELKWRIGVREIARLAEQGLEMLQGVAALVAPGGLLVAITCSLEAEENEHVIAQFLADNAGFRPLPLEEHLQEPLRAFIAGPGLWRALTADDHDGFTVQVLQRHSL